jgi:putative tricarboxylic transport membrane protein
MNLDKYLSSIGIAVAAAAAFAPVIALAQSYPSKPIEMVIHTNPGGGQDSFGRLFAEISSREKLLPQPFAVVNRPGGSGVVATTFFKTKRGDPYYLYSVATSIVLSAAYRPDLGLGLDIYTPLALYGFDLQSVTVPADSKFRSFKELLDAAKREPEGIIDGIASATGTARYFLYLLEKETGAKFKYVSFKSGGDAMTAVAGGHVHFSTENVSEAMGLVEGKKLRILAVPAQQRLPSLPDVPTLRELGYNIHAGAGRGFAMPAGVPKDAAAIMETALERAHRSPMWKDYATKNMYEDTYLGSAAFSAWLNKTAPLFGEFMQAIGIKRD